MALMALIALSFAGSALVFLPYNFNPARIFLGDMAVCLSDIFFSSMGDFDGSQLIVIMTGFFICYLCCYYLCYF